MDAAAALQLMVVTGLSGAGKTQAVRALEDLDYYCVDNLPPSLVPPLINLLLAERDPAIEQVALVMDVRGGRYFEGLTEALDFLEKRGVNLKLLFLEANDETLVRRYKETRRRHPLSPYGSILEGILKERKLLEDFRGRATKIIDTSSLTTAQLKEEIAAFFGAADQKGLRITIMSFGYKYGIPLDADLVIDVRFLPNPFYLPELKAKTGLDPEVRDYVLGLAATESFLSRFGDLLQFLLPFYRQEGKSHLMIAIGCTGGCHRSVALAEKIAGGLGSEYQVETRHRDLARGLSN